MRLLALTPAVVVAACSPTAPTEDLTLEPLAAEIVESQGEAVLTTGLVVRNVTNEPQQLHWGGCRSGASVALFPTSRISQVSLWDSRPPIGTECTLQRSVATVSPGGTHEFRVSVPLDRIRAEATLSGSVLVAVSPDLIVPLWERAYREAGWVTLPQ